MQGVQLGLSNSGYYSVYAYGLCQGRTTAMSSGLAVYNQVASSGGSSTQFATLFSVRYTGFTVETFTSADQKEVCTNVRGLQPGEAQGLTNELQAGANSTLDALTSGLSQNTTATVEAAETEESPVNPPMPQTPAGVQVTSSPQGCPATISALVSWTPVTQAGIIGYTATCFTIVEGYPNSTSVVIGASKSSAVVKKLPQEVEYSCAVSSLTVDQVSAPAHSDLFVTGICPSGPPSPPSPGVPPSPPAISIQSPGFDFSLIFPGYTSATFTTALQQQLCDNIVSVNAPAGSYEVCNIASISSWNGTNALVNGYFFYGWSVDPTTSQIQLTQALRDQTVQNLRNNASAVFKFPLNNGYPNCACKDLAVVTASSTTPFDYSTNLTGIPGPVQCGAKLIYNTTIANAQASIVGIDDGSVVAANLGKYCSSPAVAGGVLGTPGAGSCRQYGVIASAAGTTQATATISAPTNGAVTSAMVTISSGGSGYAAAPAVTISAPNPVNAVASVILTAGAQPQATVDTANGPYDSKPVGSIANAALCIDTAMDITKGCSGAIATVNGQAGYTCTNTDLNSATSCNGAACIAWAASASNQAVTGVTFPGVTTICAITPTITIDGAYLQQGVQAKATATISGGAVTGIVVNPPGSGYRTTPTITIGAPTATDLGKLCSPNPVTLSTSIAVNTPISGGITATGQCQPLGMDTQKMQVCSVPAPLAGGVWEPLNVGTCNVVSSFRNQPNPTDTATCGILAQTFVTTPSPGPAPPPASPPTAASNN